MTTIVLPAAGPRMTLEVEVVRAPPPARWRRALAVLLIHWAARLARMRVRIVE